MKMHRFLALALAFCLLLGMAQSGLASAVGVDPTQQHTHSYVYDIVRQATCTEPGLQIKTCTGCREVYVEETIPPLGHNWSQWFTEQAATCTKSGTQVRQCLRCDMMDSRTVAALGHNYAGWVVTQEATCTSTGTQTGTCTRCGAKGTQQIPLKAHSYGDWQVTQPAGAFGPGEKTRTCQVCGNAQKESFDPEGTLRKGDKGDAVKALQEKLNAAGYNCGMADGDFGGKTEAAVKALETATGHTDDGVAWPGVQALLAAPSDPGKDNISLYGLPLTPEGDPAIQLSLDPVPAGKYQDGDKIDVTAYVVNAGPRPLSLYSIDIKEGDSYTPEDWMSYPLEPETVYTFTYHLNVGAGDVYDDWFYRYVTVYAFDVDTKKDVSSTALLLVSQLKDGPSIALLIEDTTAKGGYVGDTVDVMFTCVNNGTEPLDWVAFYTIYGSDGSQADEDVVGDFSDPGMIGDFPVGGVFTLHHYVKVTSKDADFGYVSRVLRVEARVQSAHDVTVFDEVDFELWVDDVHPRETPVPAPRETPVPQPTIPVIIVPPNPTPKPTPGPTVVIVPPNPTPKPTPQPEPTPQADDGRACVPRLTGVGDNVSELTLDFCEEHDAAADAMKALLAAAVGDPALELAAWQQSAALWSGKVDALYAAIAAGRTDEERAVVENERKAFFQQLEDRKTALTLKYPDDAIPAARETALALMDRCVELCYALHFAPADRLDSLRTGQYRAMNAAQAGAVCQRREEYTEDHVIYTYTLCAVHGAMDAQIIKKVQDSAAAITEGRQLWMALLEAAWAVQGRTAERTSFLEWITAREALLKLAYPDKPELVEEVLMQAIRRRALEVCGGK